jgi:thiol-disulfide isomerase/thioredoxin
MTTTNTIMGHLLIVISLLSCGNNVTESMIIEGNLNGLPDGTVYLLNEKRTAIDSAHSSKGHFLFTIPFAKTSIHGMVYVTLEHIDADKKKRIFQFNSNRRFNNAPLRLQYFCLENGIKITGKLNEFTLKDFKLPANILLVYPDTLGGGRETAVMYNTSYDFKIEQTDSMYNELDALVKKNRESFYLMHELTINESNFKVEQLKKLYDSFDEEVQNGGDGVALKKFIERRTYNKTLHNIYLADTLNAKKLVVEKREGLQMLVFWASWCGPCIIEVPEIEKLRQKFLHTDELKITSISVDKNPDEWKGMVKKLNMNWSQLWLDPTFVDDYKDQFQFNGTIPMILFVNSKGTVVKKYIGNEEKNFDEWVLLVQSQIGK